nr:MMPL family transporter [Kineosporia sp. A_224]
MRSGRPQPPSGPRRPTASRPPHHRNTPAASSDGSGRWAAGRPWYAVLAFVLLTVALNGAGAVRGAADHDEYEVPGLKSVDGLELLRAHDRLTAAAGAEVVVHVDEGTVSSWVPVLLFAILFGLSMDYEVFLLSRIREDRQLTGDDRGSVVRGLASTTRVISAGAAIMVMVAHGFALEPDVVVKQMGVGPAAAVLLDATVVRLVLVPATMTLLGRHAWWPPAWLDRVLPQVEAEVPNDVPVTVEREPVVAAP